MLQALPALSDSELAPAVGLILKLASESQGSRGQAVHVVRQKARSCPEVGGGSLDAIRLAVTQHEDIASAMLADIDADCRQAKPATSTEVPATIPLIASKTEGCGIARLFEDGAIIRMHLFSLHARTIPCGFENA